MLVTVGLDTVGRIVGTGGGESLTGAVADTGGGTGSGLAAAGGAGCVAVREEAGSGGGPAGTSFGSAGATTGGAGGVSVARRKKAVGPCIDNP